MWTCLSLLAQTESQSFQTTEFDLPASTAEILVLAVLLTALFALTVRTSLRDSRFLSAGWRAGLLSLRVVLLLLILLVLLNPRQRIQTTEIQRSRVAVLVDTSSSMAFPAGDIHSAEGESAPVESRAEAAQRHLVDSGVLDEISRTHSVSVYTFDGKLAGPQALISESVATFASGKSADEEERVDDALAAAGEDRPDVARVDLDAGRESSVEELAAQWRGLLQPLGAETRLGESLHQLIGQTAGRTLSGIVLLSDGISNSGLDVEAAQLRAQASDTRLISVGFGSEVPQVNLWLAGMQSPSDVHRGDPFDVTVTVQGDGLSDQGGVVYLYQQTAGSDGSDRKRVDQQPFQFSDSSLPVEVRFSQQLSVPGKYEYVAVAELKDGGLHELTGQDNQRRREVEVTDRKLKTLVISSGPMRDYQFVRNTFFRHSGIESDVWLQSVDANETGFVTQEAENLLTSFPQTESQLFEYDVVVAFDANWSLLTPQQQKFFNRWVDEHSGGVVFVAGEIFTPELARDADRLRDVAVLYPVVLNRILAELRVTQRADRPWPVTLTPEGRASDFLKIADATGTADVELWKSFSGIYRSYPVRSLRDGATVLAEYGNPRARTQLGQPPFLASQFYGKGRTVFVSSAETWRLRAISPEGHQRFWTNLVREVGQGRRSRGRSRGLLLLDRKEASPGDTITIRSQLYDSRMQPLQRESVTVSIVDSAGRPVRVPDVLRRDAQRPGQFVNTFRPGRQGRYRVTVPVPESSDVLQANIEVVLPNRESENPSQDVALLTRLSDETGGTYLKPGELITRLPDLLPDRSEPVTVDEQLTTLWDRSYLMYFMVALLALEWGLRRVQKLS